MSQEGGLPPPQLYFKATLYSHCFVLTHLSPRAQGFIKQFAEEYIQYGFIRDGRYFVRAPIKVFGSRVLKGLEYRFHIEQWPKLQTFLSNLQILPPTYETTVVDVFEGVKVDMPLLPKWIERDYQKPIIKYLIDELPSRNKLVEIATGSGKDQPLDAKIKVPGGWSTMGEMYEGKKITSITGGTQVVTGVHSQGLKQQYKVTFIDGRSTECGADHLWTVSNVDWILSKRWKVVNTLEVLRLISEGSAKIYVPLIDAEDNQNQFLPIDPYLLGVILGDGGISGNTVTVTKGDQQLFKNIEPLLPEKIKLVRQDYFHQGLRKTPDSNTNFLVVALREMGLMGKLSHEKFVPNLYLHGSCQQRLALLQGLLDTDGWVDKNHSIGFGSSSKQLALDVQYLVRSLGGTARIVSSTPYYTHLGERKEGRLTYKVGIRYKKQSELFRLDSKKSRTTDEGRSTTLKLRVLSIVPTRIVESQCISVSSPEGLYVTDDFVVTHNTFCTMKATSILKYRTLVILKPSFIPKWTSDVKELCGLEGDDVKVIQGTPELQKLLRDSNSRHFKPKVIIVSSRTLQRWYQLYEKFGSATLKKGYPCLPQDMMQQLGCGMRIIDEVHADFHLHFKIDTYTNVKWSISLSATLKADDGFLNRMYELAYPRAKRFEGIPYTKFIHAYAWFYQVRNPNSIRSSEWGSTTYSHHAFEKSIRRNRILTDDYFEMINKAMREFYLVGYKPGNRLLIYCASVELCTQLVSYLKNIHPTLDIRRYVEEDPYENLMTADVSVSTLLSAGTGHDIANLTAVIMTTAIKSSQSNIQGFGRLRNLPDKEMKFCYFVCTNIPKQVAYHESKKDILANMAKTYTTRHYPKELG